MASIRLTDESRRATPDSKLECSAGTRAGAEARIFDCRVDKAIATDLNAGEHKTAAQPTTAH